MIEWIDIKEQKPLKIRVYPVLINGDEFYYATWHPGKDCFVDMGLLMELRNVTHWRMSDD